MVIPASMPATLEALARSIDLHPAVVERLVPLLRDPRHAFRDKVALALELLGGVVPDWPLLADWNRWCLQSGARFFVWQPERGGLSERTRLETLVHATIMIAAKEQTVEDYLRAKVREVEITMAGDDCAICDPHRHKVVTLSDWPTDALPPFHPGCRCGFLPRLE